MRGWFIDEKEKEGVATGKGRLFDWDNGFCTLTVLAEGDSEVSLKEAMEALIPRWERRWKQRETERKMRGEMLILFVSIVFYNNKAGIIYNQVLTNYTRGATRLEGKEYPN